MDNARPTRSRGRPRRPRPIPSAGPGWRLAVELAFGGLEENMSRHQFYEVNPEQEGRAHSLDRAVEMITSAFPEVEFDPAAALIDADKRRASLVALGAPEKIVAAYENPRVTRIRLTEDWCDGAYVEFDLWDGQGILVYPKPEEASQECEVLAKKLAMVLGYTCSTEEYD